MKAGKQSMKLKLLKKLMIVCMTFSLSLTMVPAAALASGKDSSGAESVQVIPDDTEADHKNTEKETKHHKETEVKCVFVPETETETPAVPETYAPETQQTTVAETEAVPQMNASGKQTRAAGKINVTPGTYTLENGVYKITADATMTLNEGASVNAIEIADKVTLTIVTKGTKDNSIGSIRGAGSVKFAKSSNGKINIKGSVETAAVAVEGGTLHGSGTIGTTDVNTGISLSGGSIACNIKPGVSVKNGSVACQRIEFKVESNAVCKITDVLLDSNDSGAEENTIWSDSNGKAVVYLPAASTVSFSIKAVTFDTQENTLTAKEQNYTYEDGEVKKGKSSVAYSVKAGADLKTTYGEKLENEDVITVTSAKDYTPEVSLADYDEALESSLELKDGTTKGYKVTKKNVKEEPGTQTFELNEVKVTDTLGFEHILSGTVTYTVEK